MLQTRYHYILHTAYCILHTTYYILVHTSTYYLSQEMPTRSVVPILLWCYMFFATIVLVNLLIAQVRETSGVR